MSVVPMANRTGDDSWGGVGTNKTPPKEGRGLKVGIFSEKPFSGLNPKLVIVFV